MKSAALLMSAVSLGAGYWYWAGGHPEWQTVVFTVLAFSQMGHVVAIRSNTIPFWRRGPSPNRALLATVAVTVALQFAVTYVPAAQSVFRTVALPPGDVVVALLLAAVVPVAVEIEKWRVRRSR